MTSLTILDFVPAGFLEAKPCDLHRIMDGPTLIELDGAKGPPLFVSGLLHGNEDSGLVAIQRVLRNLGGQTLPRPLLILIGNVAAARTGMRRLEKQPDYNRVWPGGSDDQDSPEARIMAQVHQRVLDRKAFAAIDIHNNTGRNPHYSVICVQEESVMALAALFAPRAVLFRGLPGTQTASFSGLIPAITVECGQPGIDSNAEAAARLVEAALTFQTPRSDQAAKHITLFHTLARIRVKSEVSLAKTKHGAWLSLADGLDLHNFEEVKTGFRLGETNDPMPVEVIDEHSQDVADSFLEVKAGQVLLKRPVVPAMLTTDERVIRQDCLCYLMEELEPVS